MKFLVPENWTLPRTVASASREYKLLRRNSSSFFSPPLFLRRLPSSSFFLSLSFSFFFPAECRGNNVIRAALPLSPLPRRPTSFDVFPFESCSCITTARLRRVANLFGDPNEVSILFFPLFPFSFLRGLHARARVAWEKRFSIAG